jgi:hypothetical protein
MQTAGMVNILITLNIKKYCKILTLKIKKNSNLQLVIFEAKYCYCFVSQEVSALNLYALALLDCAPYCKMINKVNHYETSITSVPFRRMYLFHYRCVTFKKQSHGDITVSSYRWNHCGSDASSTYFLESSHITINYT